MFEVGTTFNTAIDKVLSFKPLRQVLTNPILTALIIVLVLMIIIYITKGEDDSVSWYNLAIWGGGSTIAILFLYTHLLTDEVIRENRDPTVDNIIRGSGDTVFARSEKDYVHVEKQHDNNISLDSAVVYKNSLLI